MWIILFIFGTAVGSFLNVLNSRYSEKTGFKKALKGRSYCDQCHKTLSWYELIPVVSFLALFGRCRECREPIPRQYFLIEILAGLVLVFVPLKIGFTFFTFVWVGVLWLLLLISIIDLRLKVIPDPLVVMIGILGAASITYRYIAGLAGAIGVIDGVDLIGNYSLILRFGFSPLANHLAAVLASAFLFGGVYFFTKGRAMGFGDVKLIIALGALIAWPDIMVVLIAPFIIGSIVGLPLMYIKKIGFKSAIPFGPFIAIGVFLTFFFGYDITNAYFGFFGLI